MSRREESQRWISVGHRRLQWRVHMTRQLLHCDAMFNFTLDSLDQHSEEDRTPPFTFLNRQKEDEGILHRHHRHHHQVSNTATAFHRQTDDSGGGGGGGGGMRQGSTNFKDLKLWKEGGNVGKHHVDNQWKKGSTLFQSHQYVRVYSGPSEKKSSRAQKKKKRRTHSLCDALRPIRHGRASHRIGAEQPREYFYVSQQTTTTTGFFIFYATTSRVKVKWEGREGKEGKGLWHGFRHGTHSQEDMSHPPPPPPPLFPSDNRNAIKNKQ